jgi:hypothetical protein
MHRRFVTKTLTNWSFYKGGDGQWIFEEDLEAFFLDESGDVRNRLKIAKNLIRPMVEQYVGNAVRFSFNAEAKATSDFAINAREQELARIQFFEGMAGAFPELNEMIRDRVPLGDTPIETEEIFLNTWVDDYEDDINMLLEFISNEVNIDELKVQITKHMSISGMGIYKGYEQNGRYLGEATDPLFYFWDLSARKPDLSDAEYMGEWSYMDTPTLFEKYQNLTKEERQALERYSQNESIEIHRMVHNYYTVSGIKVPVYEVYWKDMEEHEYGYVKDPFGYAYFTRINHEESEYTDKDLIEPPNDSKEDILKGKKKAKVYVDVLRYCVFVPKEEVGVATSTDILLEWGELDYQEKQAIDPSNVQFPYKVYTWSYDKGEVMSPLDDAIQPQRFVNRLLSVAESHINNARGEGTVIAKDAVDPRDGEEGVLRNVNKSKPIFVDTSRTGSVQNSVGSYGGGIGSGTMSIFNIVKEMQVAIQDMTGVNEAMTGTQGGSDALVGVIQSQIQRGSLVQEPFYWALSSILRQAYQHMATVGKRIYADNPRRLAIMVGDKGMQDIIVTREMMLEDFRVFIKRAESKDSAIQNGNALLFTLRQAGLLDDYRVGNLFNRATPEQIAKSLREYQSQLLQASRKQDDENANMAMQQQSQMADMAQRMEQSEMREAYRDDANKQLDRDHQFNMAMAKEGAKNDREEMKMKMNAGAEQ